MDEHEVNTFIVVMDHDVVVYIEEQYSEGSLLSSLVIPPFVT